MGSIRKFFPQQQLFRPPQWPRASVPAPWELSADKITHNKKKKSISYENVWLKIYDTPVVYFPKFFHPDPTVERQSGFLIPSFKTSPNNNTFLSIPYYKVLDNNRDFTFTPRLYAKDQLLAQNEYRQVNKSSKFITDFSIGDEVYGASDRSGAGIIPTGTTITGFGTAVGIVTFVNSAGITTGVEVTLDFATLSNAVTNNINKDIGTSFYVGVVSSYYYADLSAAPNATGISSSFIIIRPGDLTNIEFESTKNPIDPVEIGIARGANIGKGHRLELINNGDPDITAQWREIIEDPEPAVGAGRVEYYIGTTQWPTISRRDSDGDVVTTHATLGQRVIVGVGATIGAGIGYTGTPPAGAIPGDCGTYDTAIIDAETELQNLINASTPKINHYINGADSLRQLRDDDETKAWGYLQAIGFNNAKASRQLSQAETIEDFNWPDVGITT